MKGKNVKRILLAILLGTLSVGLMACSQEYYLPTGYNNVPEVAVTKVVVVPQGDILDVVQPRKVNVNDQTFIFPTKVCLDSVTSGTVKDIRLQVHNGGDSDTSFEVYLVQPTDHSNLQMFDPHTPTLVGIYDAPPVQVRDWVIVDSPMFVQAKWTEDIHVKLDIPLGMILPARWYFYIVAKDAGQSEIQYAVGSTIFVNSQ